MPQPLYTIRTQERANGSKTVVVDYSPILAMLPVTERERTLYEASVAAYERVLEAFEESTHKEAVA